MDFLICGTQARGKVAALVFTSPHNGAVETMEYGVVSTRDVQKMSIIGFSVNTRASFASYRNL